MKFYLSLFFLFLYLSGDAQKTSVLLEKGDAYYQIREYENAVKYYSSIRDFENDPYVLERLAVSYMFLNMNEKAELCFRKLNHIIPLDDSLNFYYAFVLKKNAKYDKAKIVYQKLYNSNSGNVFYKTLMNSCDSARCWILTPADLKVENLVAVNSPYSEISAVGYKSGIVFCSNREDVIIKKKTGFSEIPFYDLYLSEEDTGGVFSDPEKFSSVINSIHHEGPVSFTGDFKKIFFTRGWDEQKNNGEKVNRLKLYNSEEVNGKWMSPHKFVFNDSAYSFAHPSIEANERMFFFASDMKGGYGGSDIYVCFNIENEWTDPLNLGPVINTPGNEMYPFYHQGGTLYFASDGHLGIGGLDIFVANQKNGDWISVTNLKYPVNTSFDDFSIWWNADKTKAFFSSNRSGGVGKEDIYKVELK